MTSHQHYMEQTESQMGTYQEGLALRTVRTKVLRTHSAVSCGAHSCGTVILSPADDAVRSVGAGGTYVFACREFPLDLSVESPRTSSRNTRAASISERGKVSATSRGSRTQVLLLNTSQAAFSPSPKKWVSGWLGRQG